MRSVRKKNLKKVRETARALALAWVLVRARARALAVRIENFCLLPMSRSAYQTALGILLRGECLRTILALPRNCLQTRPAGIRKVPTRGAGASVRRRLSRAPRIHSGLSRRILDGRESHRQR